MNRLQFATLLSWAGEQGVAGRKRLQKVIFLLQQIGCDLDCHYILHHFGPYSREVASICDEMVAAGLVKESQAPGTKTYRYELKPKTKELLNGSPADQDLVKFKCQWTKLLSENLWTLELGSTILFFYSQDKVWESSIRKACDFKKKSLNAPGTQIAMEFAKKFIAKATPV